MFLRSKFQEFMLKNRSSTVTSKQGLMCDPPSAAASPTSILETMAFSSIRNSSRKVSKEFEEETRGIGLGLLDVLTNEDSVTAISKQEKRVVVFGPKLKIQIPSPATESIFISSVGRSPIEFGIKTRNSLVALYPSSPAQRTLIPRSEMAQSEDYTRVILHGPNPKTTHIFEDCIIESGSSQSTDHVNWNCSCGDGLSSPVNDLSSFSNGCRKRTDTGGDFHGQNMKGNSAATLPLPGNV
ncbi:FCS-Like Zinc finger 8-like [Zingiber officinale]|uniref:FCS-Like Zinc finger 8-like n=1 Tax=Zingiber officinale TaxID=94328 RepID=UPI001C4C154E|nr:FCS-Like Zinc finger 8-like [Zingiber officinale]